MDELLIKARAAARADAKTLIELGCEIAGKGNLIGPNEFIENLRRYLASDRAKKRLRGEAVNA